MHRILKIAVLTAALSFSLNPAFAWDFGQRNKKKAPKAQVNQLLWAVSHNPSFMQVDYLKLAIGNPVSEGAPAGDSQQYIWYDSDRKPAYELSHLRTAGGIETTMLFHLKGDSINFDRLHELYGTQSRRFFDYTGQPNELYTFAPNTYLAFVSPPNSFGATEAKVLYRGPALPPPTAEDLAAAKAALASRAQAASDADANYQPGKETNSPLADRSELLPLLAERAKLNPMDPRAHLALAIAFKRDARLNEAIGEFKLALALSGSDPEVREACLRKLDEMMMLPPALIPARRNLEIVDNGQHMRVVGEEEQSKNGKSNNSR